MPRQTTTQVDHQIVIIGAGFSGIGVAIKLEEAGLRDYLIIEAGSGVGGTWYWNTYPGIAVDIPSFSYQFSFEKHSDWSRVYAPGTELRQYAEDCVDKYKIRNRIQFDTKITEASYDDADNLWRLGTSNGEEITARFLLNCSGVLTTPKAPDIPGVEDFAGVTLHTARWDHTQDLRGKRVAVIGTGASAVQLIPEIADEVEHLTVFQRTPVWCLPKFDAPLPDPVRTALAYIPGSKAIARLISQTYVEVTFPLTAHYYSRIPLVKTFERFALRYLAQQVPNREIRAKLTPHYGLGCKRPTFHNTYYATYSKPNVYLETTPIREVTPTAVVTTDGTVHEIDVLVTATGFKVMESDNMPTYQVVGSGGVPLAKFWDEHRMQAYEGVSMPGFPNYFSIMGPYGYNGSSYFALIEHQTRHIMRCLKRAARDGANRVEVKPEANDRYFAEMMAKRGSQVFWHNNCSGANSYYFNKDGDVPLRPGLTLNSIARSYRFDLNDYEFYGLSVMADLEFGADAPLDNVMRSMRAMRRLKPDPVPRELLEQLVEAATYGPSGGNNQTYSFVVVDDRDQMARLAPIWQRIATWYLTTQTMPPHMDPAAAERLKATLQYQADHFAETPAIIVACYEMHEAIGRVLHTPAKQVAGMRGLGPKYSAMLARNMRRFASTGESASVYPGVQNLLLMARVLGLGATLTTWHTMFEQEFKAVLGIPRNVHTYAVVPVGWPMGKFGRVNRKPASEAIHWDRW